MRLDSYNKGDVGWLVWHVEQCRQVDRVLWVDDVTAEYCQLRYPIVVVGDELMADVVQVRRISILSSIHLVLVNPVDPGQVGEQDLLVDADAMEGRFHGAH